MRLSKLNFISRIGDAAFTYLLEAAKTSIAIEKFVKMIDWATPESDGTSIDTNDYRVQELRILEPLLISQGIVEAGWADLVLADAPPGVETPYIHEFIQTHTVQGLGPAMVEADGTVRLEDGRWTTLAALTAMGKTVEAI